MCYNCGCGIPDDPMGKGRIKDNGGSLTEEDIKQMVDKWGMTVIETKKNILDMLQKQLVEKNP